MAKKPKVNMPQSTAGLVRYYDQESGATIKFKPEQVLVAAVVIIAIELAIRFMF